MRARRDAYPSKVKRYRPESLVIVDLARSAVFEHGNGPVTDEIVQSRDGVGREAIKRNITRRVPGRQDRFTGASQEKWGKKLVIGLVGK
jgi:hypothetical protein